MKAFPSVVTGLVAGVALAASVATVAQPFGGMGPGFGPGMGMGPGHGPMANVDPAAMAESRLADMKSLLKITASQETAWQAFASASKQQAASTQAMRKEMWESGGNAADRMALRATLMQQRSDGMAAVSSAFNALYAVLTPEQKAIADQSFGMHGPRGRGFHGPAG